MSLSWRLQTSIFGAMFDIAADRIVELSLWITFVGLGVVSIWVPIVFIVRGSIVDAIRAQEVSKRNLAPFDTIQPGIGKWLVASQFMRVIYATIKAITFCWLLLILQIPHLVPNFWGSWRESLELVSQLLILITVSLCLLRGLPRCMAIYPKQGQSALIRILAL